MNINSLNELDVPHQKIYLEKLQNDLQNLNDDRIHLIRHYLNQAGLHSHLPMAMIDTRDRLRQQPNTSLYNSFVKVKSDWVSYIGRKIERLNENSEKLSPEFLQISEDLQDVLTACQIVVEHDFKEGLDTIGNDLQDLIQRFSEIYVPFLKKEAKHKSKNLDSLINGLDQGLKKLAIELKKDPQSPEFQTLIQNLQDTIRFFSLYP